MVKFAQANVIRSVDVLISAESKFSTFLFLCVFVIAGVIELVKVSLPTKQHICHTQMSTTCIEIVLIMFFLVFLSLTSSEDALLLSK